jgi:hypothetical protein
LALAVFGSAEAARPGGVGYTIAMFGDGALSLQEYVMRDPLPLATIHHAILEFLRDRDDVVLFGAQAVNAYVDEPRMTQDVDVLCVTAADFAEELRASLAAKFQIALRLRTIGGGKGFRVYQVRETGNRHLADVRQVSALPPARVFGGILVPVPEELIAQKVISFALRAAQPRGDTDRRDLKVLLLAHPALKTNPGPVRERLLANGAPPAAIRAWAELVDLRIEQPTEDDEF